MYYVLLYYVYCIVHILLCIHRYVNRWIFGARGKKKAPDHAPPTTSARVSPSPQTDSIASRSFCTYVTHTARCTYGKVGRDSKLVLPRRTDDFYSRRSTAFLPIYYNIMPEAMHGKYIILYYTAVSHIIWTVFVLRSVWELSFAYIRLQLNNFTMYITENYHNKVKKKLYRSEVNIIKFRTPQPGWRRIQ